MRTVIANRNSVQSLVPRWADAIDLFLGVIGWFTAVVLNSRAVEQEYGKHPRRYRKRLLRIDHGFERKTTVLSREHARRVLGLPIDAVLLGDVARFHPIKNLTAAIRLLPGRDWHLALVGQGAQREKLIEFARSLGVLDRLHLVGELPPSRVGDFLGALDAFVFPSLDETFGLAVVEAAQAGVPVVANDLDVLREVLAVDGAPCALFVDVSDTEAFARAVQRLIKDPDLRTQLQSRAARLTNRYALDAMVRGYADLIEALRRRPASPARPGPGPRHAG